MTPDRWTQIEELFHATLEQAAGDRDAYLRRQCGEDADLLREVESLLTQSENSQNPIAAAVAGAVTELPRDTSAVGQHIGPYQIAGIIGEGGMGTVYHAVRDDDQYRKRVALKVVKRGMDTDHIIHRFRQERQILAGLEHPNIARLLDGGTTTDGLPYFVMEYIEGDTIIQHCRAKALSIPERLKLFHDVCLAVQHAHQKLIIHRDIKPTNLLVGVDGVPKLLDFGIAKLLGPELTTEMPTATMTMLRLMTPDYASPEQARGLSISTATDVYSLGAVLFELLTEQKPHRIKNYTPSEIEHAICITETEKPSTVAARSTGGSAKLPRILAGDLDNIVLMAMRKEPERRYQSAGQLAEDIRRYLKNLPVIARPDTFRYRAGKFVQRNKLALLAVSVILLSLVGGIITSVYQARRAERRFQEVRKLANTFLFDFHDQIKDLPGATKAREMVVSTALQYLDSLAKEAQGDASLQWELAEAYQKVADVQGDPRGGNLGHPEEAIQSYTKSLHLLQELRKAEPDNLPILRSLAGCHYKVGDLQVEMGNLTAGMDTLRKGLLVEEVLHEKKTDNNRDDLLTYIRLHRSLGDAILKSRNPAETLRVERKALELTEQMLRQFPDDISKHQWTLTMIRVGEALIELGDLPAGIEAYNKVLRVREELVRKNPSDTNIRREWRVIHVWLGNHYGGIDTFNLGDRAKAEEYYRKALGIAEELAGADPKNARWQYDLSICYAKVAEVDPDPVEALALYVKADAINRDLMASSPQEFRFLSREALYARSRAVPLRKLGRNAEAIESLRASLRTLNVMEQQAPGSPEVESGSHAALLLLAAALLESGDTKAALESYQKALEIAENRASASTSDLYAKWRLTDSYDGMSKYTAATGDRQQAIQWRTKSYEIWKAWPMFAKTSTVFNKSREEAAVRDLTSGF